MTKTMTKDTYLDAVTEQIQCKAARAEIRRELEMHIEDQAQAYEEEGCSKEEALAQAVVQMGNPQETGEALNRIHRPKTDWILILLAIGIAVFGIVVQCLLFPTMGNEVIAANYRYHTIAYHIIGIGVMLGIFFFDYRIIGRRVWALYLVYLLASGAVMYLPIGYAGNLVIGNMIWAMFVPLFAGFIYYYRDEKLKGMCKCLAILLLQILMASLLGCRAMSMQLVVLFVCGLTIFFAAIKDLYGGQKKVQIGVLLTVFVFTPGAMLSDIVFMEGRHLGLAVFQIERFKAMLHLQEYAESYGYTANLARNQIKQAALLGNQSFGEFQTMNVAYSEYLLTCAVSYFGILVVAVLLTLIGSFLFRALHLSWKQKNRLGFLLSVSASSMLIVKSVIYLFSNLGLFPGTSIDMPFLSYGFYSNLVNYSYLGLILSVYRYTNIFGKKDTNRKRRWTIKISRQ